MSEDLSTMVNSSRGKDPSDKFVAELRSAVLAQSGEAPGRMQPTSLSLHQDHADDPTIVDFEFQNERESKMNIKLLVGGLIAAAVIVIAGFVAAAGGDGTNEKLETIDEDPATTTTQAFEAGAEPSAEDRAVIERFFAVEGWEDLEAALTPAALETLVQFEFEDFSDASGIVGARTTVDSCSQVGETVVRCQISSTSAIIEAMGEDPVTQDATFNLADGRIATMPGVSLLTETRSFGQFARDAGIETELGEACEPNYFDGPCAQFMMDNLDDWVAWDKEQS